MIWTEQTRLAYAIALAAHKGQVDKAGRPYIEHVRYVAEQMTDEVSTTVALLHDLFEDTLVTADDLTAPPISMPAEVISSVSALTHRKDDGRTYMEYIADVAKNPVAKTVKIADLNHNMMLERLGHDATEQDISRNKRYAKALMYLQEN